ncbi:hypothetical protein COU59_00800 [Candidatus Pacearchaeota archaeon CG10_big_fil_rev_8_21_14_0_10_34_12]|nr:MAG: hypothetical protein COU59_00800 [Candidatus Pacearchaeota archaeon CG10_big_fil_rev_8_21_14_0_10_34_12]
MEKQTTEDRLEHYSKVYESAKFTDWNGFHLCLNDLEETVLDVFPDNTPLMKLVGSSATRTMRRGEEDLDFAVAFQNPMTNEEFLSRLKERGLEITEINQNRKYGYTRISGRHNRMDFVLVPMRNPNGHIQTYEQDAFYHPDFINKHKKATHARNVILMKEFFEQIGVYKEVKGIGCELMTLYFRDFDAMLDSITKTDSLRINFSPYNLIYSSAPLIIDYPHLGRRSFTEKVTREIYRRIQEFAKKVLRDFEILKIKEK